MFALVSKIEEYRIDLIGDLPLSTMIRLKLASVLKLNS